MKEKSECKWVETYHESEFFETDCGEVFEFIENPEASGFKFCCFCGGKLKQESYKGDNTWIHQR